MRTMGEQVATRFLLIVSRDEPNRLAYFKYVYGSTAIEVILDRRTTQRRQRQAWPAVERRRAERRRRDISKDLQKFGWALVRR